MKLEWNAVGFFRGLEAFGRSLIMFALVTVFFRAVFEKEWPPDQTVPWLVVLIIWSKN